MTTLKAAFFLKNIPGWERSLRILLGLTGALVSLLFLSAPGSLFWAGSALGFALTGVVGFCPACALVGRRLRKQD